MICKLFSGSSLEDLQQQIQHYINNTESEKERISINSTTPYYHGSEYSLLLWHRIIEKKEQKQSQEQEAIPAKRHAPLNEELTEEQTDKLAMLKDWRTQKAKSKGMPPYFVSTDALFQIAYFHPKTTEELSTIKFIGEKILNNYGDEIIDVLNE